MKAIFGFMAVLSFGFLYMALLVSVYSFKEAKPIFVMFLASAIPSIIYFTLG